MHPCVRKCSFIFGPPHTNTRTFSEGDHCGYIKSMTKMCRLRVLCFAPFSHTFGAAVSLWAISLQDYRYLSVLMVKFWSLHFPLEHGRLGQIVCVSASVSVCLCGCDSFFFLLFRVLSSVLLFWFHFALYWRRFLLLPTVGRILFVADPCCFLFVAVITLLIDLFSLPNNEIIGGLLFVWPVAGFYFLSRSRRCCSPLLLGLSGCWTCYRWWWAPI